MQITVKLFAMLSDYLPAGTRGNQVSIEVAAGSTVAAALAPFNLPARLTHLVLVNGVFILPDERTSCVLAADDVLAIWPPIAGG
jgi:sulfur carrier protein ThiS